MASFTDVNGQKWLVSLNVFSIKQVKELLDVDLLSDQVHETLACLMEDIVKTIDILYVVCTDQPDKAGIDDVTFGKNLGGDNLHEAVEALVTALTDFFPNPRRREWVKKLWDKTTGHLARADEEMLAVLENEDIEKEMTTQLENAKEEGVKNVISGLRSIGSPESQESTPTP